MLWFSKFILQCVVVFVFTGREVCQVCFWSDSHASPLPLLASFTGACRGGSCVGQQVCPLLKNLMCTSSRQWSSSFGWRVSILVACFKLFHSQYTHPVNLNGIFLDTECNNVRVYMMVVLLELYLFMILWVSPYLIKFCVQILCDCQIHGLYQMHRLFLTLACIIRRPHFFW